MSRVDQPDGPSTAGGAVWRSATVAALALVGVLAALIAQARLDASKLDQDAAAAQEALMLGAVLFVVGAVAWAASARLEDLRSPARATWRAKPGPGRAPWRRRRLLAGLGLVALTTFLWPAVVGGPDGGGLGLLAYPGGATDPESHITLPGLVLWLVGSWLAISAVAVTGGWELRRRRFVGITLPGLTLTAITLLGAYYRLRDLAGLPPEMTSDHTEKLEDVAKVLSGLRPAFFWENAGREALQFYWTALLVELGMPFGFTTLKFGMAVVSIATIPLIYVLARRFGGQVTGLFAALVLALMPWHLQITRIGLRTAFSPLFVTLVLILLFRAVDSGRRNDWLAVGVTSALGLYGYTGYRPMLLGSVVVLGLAAWTAWRRHGPPPRRVVERLGAHLSVAAMAGVLVLAPVIRYAIDRPESFLYRTMTRVTTAEQGFQVAPWRQFLVNFWDALLMFNYQSDAGWFQSPAGRPALETVGGALLVLGVIMAIRRTRDGDWRSAALLLLVPIMLLSTVLALAFPIENPSLTRAAGAIPPVAILAAMPLTALWRRLRAAAGELGSTVFFGLAVVLFLLMAANVEQRVFVEWREQYTRTAHNTSEIAEVLRGFVELGGSMEHAYIIGWPHGPDYRAIGQEAGDLAWQGNLFDPASDGAESVALVTRLDHPADPARKLYIVGGPFAESNLERLQEIFPDAWVTRHASDSEGKDFYSVLVPGS